MNEQKLRSFLEARFPGFDAAIGPDDDLSGVVDSLGLFDLVAFVESEFDIAIPTGMFSPDRFSTLNRIVEFIDELQTFQAQRR